MLRQAEEVLIADCMSERGFKYIRVPADNSDPFSLSKLYGSISVAQAETFGYHSPTARQLTKSEADAAAAERSAAQQGSGYYPALVEGSDSCTSVALTELYGATVRPAESADAAELLSLGGDAQTRTAADPRLSVAVDVWKQCMRESGYDFKVLSDSRMSFPSEPADTSPPSNDERRMAVKDAHCRGDAELDSVIVTIYTEAFTELLEQHTALQEEIQTTFDDAETRAREVLDQPAD